MFNIFDYLPNRNYKRIKRGKDATFTLDGVEVSLVAHKDDELYDFITLDNGSSTFCSKQLAIDQSAGFKITGMWVFRKLYFVISGKSVCDYPYDLTCYLDKYLLIDYELFEPHKNKK